MSLEVGVAAGAVAKIFLVSALGGTAVPMWPQSIQAPAYPKVEACMRAAVNKIEMPDGKVTVQYGSSGEIIAHKHMQQEGGNPQRFVRVSVSFDPKGVFAFSAVHSGSYGSSEDVLKDTSATDAAAALAQVGYDLKKRKFAAEAKKTVMGQEVDSLQRAWVISTTENVGYHVQRCLVGAKGKTTMTNMGGVRLPSVEDISPFTVRVTPIRIFVQPRIVGGN